MNKDLFDIQKLLAEIQLAAADVFGMSLREVILFGSYARGTHDEWSDIDVMVLYDNIDAKELAGLQQKMVERTVAVGGEFGKLISIVFQNYGFFNHWAEFLPFYENVKNEGLRYYVAA